MPDGTAFSGKPAGRDSLLGRARRWRDQTLADPRFREWATRFPLTRPVARRRTRALFDLCAGFVYAQVLHACIELRVFEILAEQTLDGPALAARLGLSVERTERLLGAAASLRLVTRRRGVYALGPLGAATVGNPAVTEMVRHHALLYADLADPVALLRAPPGQTRLAAYWPYGSASDPASLAGEKVADYSALMAASQAMVAAQVLDAYDMRRHRCLLDVGGGDGSFLRAAAARAPGLKLKLFDLPAVVAAAAAKFASTGLPAETLGGDVYRDQLPAGADVVSLIRVVHDHDDERALAILRAVRRALPDGGTLLLAEPMAETAGAEPVEAYFAFYLLALGSGRPRSAAGLRRMLAEAGFRRSDLVRTAAPLVASLIVARA